MIIIDESADIKLAATLETLKATPGTTRCIYFNLMGKNAIETVKEHVIALARQHITSTDTQMYLCEDGDICILAPTLARKDGREFIIDVASRINEPISDAWVGFYEVSPQINKLLMTVEKKLENRRKADAALKILHERQQVERKRHAILSSSVSTSSEEITSRRAARSHPEFMIIEDDAFSRKLVENVLQKQYHMTGLGTADRALATYASLAPDMLLLDINLPDVTGHELLEKIIALDPDAYVIMLSGNCDQENIMQAMKRGAKGFIAKPFTRDKLFQYIDRCPTLAGKQRGNTHH